MLKSTIFVDEKVKNVDKKSGGLDYYYPCLIRRNGKFALFTRNELMKAIERGEKNKEKYLSVIEG